MPNARNFRLTLKVLDLGFHAIGRMDLRAVARPVLRSLVGEVNEAASLGVLDGGHAVYVERVQAGLVRLGVDVRVGSRIPVYCTAIGHALLAHLSRAEQLRALEAVERQKLTPTTPTTIGEIVERLERVRRKGHAVSDQEVVGGLRVLAAPVLDEDGHPIAAVSVAAPALHMPLEEFIARAAKPVMEAAGVIGSQMRAAGHFHVQPTDVPSAPPGTRARPGRGQ